MWSDAVVAMPHFLAPVFCRVAFLHHNDRISERESKVGFTYLMVSKFSVHRRRESMAAEVLGVACHRTMVNYLTTGGKCIHEDPSQAIHS